MLNLKITEVTIDGTCAYCGKHETRTITWDEYENLQNPDLLITQALPDRDAEFREFFLGSNMCAECWDKYLKEDEEDM